MPATGEDIPPELFETILTFLKSSVVSLENDTLGGVGATKREIGAISLVSRYWAKMSRRRIFSKIELRSANDIYALRSFIRCPISQIAKYVVNITIPPVKNSDVPWIHLLPLLWAELPSKEWYLDVYLEGPFSPKQGGMRSVHRVPRPIPSFSQYIDTLWLKKITFRRFNDLVALVEELRQLNKLYCEELTWPEDTATPKLAQRRAHALFNDASMTDCTSNWRAMWFMAGFSALEDPWWPESDWDAFLPLLRSLESGLPAKCTSRKLRIMDRGAYCSFVRSCQPSAHDAYAVSPSAQYSGMIDGTSRQLACVTSICSTSEGARHRRIECLTVDFVHGLEPDPCIDIDDAANYDWQAFGESVVRMDALRKIVFGFRSKEDFATCVEVIVQRLPPQVLERDRLSVVYAIWKEKPDFGLLGGTWQYASREPGADLCGK